MTQQIKFLNLSKRPIHSWQFRHYCPISCHKNQSSERYKRFQTQDVQAAATSEGIVHKVIPSSTFLDSAASLVLPPLPSMKYIVDPSSRDNVIIHDKIYYEKDLPVANTEEKLSSFEKLEEEIAREYHKNMGWRKVVVKIKPDAHNNIFVRRRFANAYGWPVIQHLVENHFGQNRSSDLKIPMVATKMNESLSTDSLDRELDLSRIASRDLISKQNDEIDKILEKKRQRLQHQLVMIGLIQNIMEIHYFH